jgi:hypothetical protein
MIIDVGSRAYITLVPCQEPSGGASRRRCYTKLSIECQGSEVRRHIGSTCSTQSKYFLNVMFKEQL